MAMHLNSTKFSALDQFQYERELGVKAFNFTEGYDEGDTWVVLNLETGVIEHGDNPVEFMKLRNIETGIRIVKEVSTFIDLLN